MEEKLLLRVEEASELLNVGRAAVYDLMRLGTLSSVKIGRSRRIPVAALRACIEQLTEAAGGDAA